MYKVFIENKVKTYQLESEAKLLQQFADHGFIEAAGGLVRRGNRFLFIRRNGVWDIPKGKLDEGESVEEAAVREIEEECGLRGVVIKDHLIDTWHTYIYGGKKVLKKTYWFVLDDGGETIVPVPQFEEGIVEIRFLPPQSFDEIQSNTYASIIEVMDALLFHLDA